jgi:prepilin-type processing-associated H-X9-DG protein
MSVVTPRNRGRAGRMLHLIAGTTIAVALVLMPPPLPRFGPSLATPLTTSTLSQLALLLAWVVLAVLALVLLRRALTPERVLPPPWWTIRPPRMAFRPRPKLRSAIPPALRLLVAHRATPLADALATGVEHPNEQADNAMASRKPVATVRLLGPVTIEGVRRPRRAATVELLVYLALHPGGASRDELLEAMWPGQDPRRTRPRLWQSASEARRLLGNAFERDGERYRLDPTRVVTDIAEVDDLLEAAKAADGSAIARGLLECAASQWRGEPLGGADYAWADGHARRLTATLVDLLNCVGGLRLDSGDARGALRAAEQGLELDELNESFVRLAIRAEAELGQRDRLNERYNTFRAILDARFGLEPERDTRLLYRRLLGPV